MTNQPKYYVGIAECGCIEDVMQNLPHNQNLTGKVVAEMMRAGLRVEPRDVISDFGGHTCGKDGAK